MLSSLTNTFLGILTVSEVHELIDIFKGKGKRDITPFLESYLAESKDSEQILEKDKKRILFKTDATESQEDEFSSEGSQEGQTAKKGVLFILDSFRKTKRYHLITRYQITPYCCFRTKIL